MICVRLPYCPTLMTFPLLPQPRIIPCIFLSLFSHTFSNFIFSRISFFSICFFPSFYRPSISFPPPSTNEAPLPPGCFSLSFFLILFSIFIFSCLSRISIFFPICSFPSFYRPSTSFPPPSANEAPCPLGA